VKEDQVEEEDSQTPHPAGCLVVLIIFLAIGVFGFRMLWLADREDNWVNSGLTT
jgi:hypothetical protein